MGAAPVAHDGAGWIQILWLLIGTECIGASIQHSPSIWAFSASTCSVSAVGRIEPCTLQQDINWHHSIAVTCTWQSYRLQVNQFTTLSAHSCEYDEVNSATRASSVEQSCQCFSQSMLEMQLPLAGGDVYGCPAKPVLTPVCHHGMSSRL